MEYKVIGESFSPESLERALMVQAGGQYLFVSGKGPARIPGG